MLENIKQIAKKLNLSKITDRLDDLIDDQIAVGLDIGFSSIKVVETKATSGGVSIISYCIKEIPQGAHREDEGLIVNAVKEIFKSNKISSKKVRLVISDPNIYLRHINVQKVAEAELSKAIKWQAEKYLPFAVDDAIVDFQILGGSSSLSENEMEIAIVAAENKIVNMYVSILRKAGLVPAVIDVVPFAIAKVFSKLGLNDNQTVSIVDIGSKVTSVVILKGNSIRLVRNAGIDTATTEQHLSHEQLSEIVNQINRSFAYYEKEYVDEKIDKVIISGGGSRFQGIAQALSEQLNIQAEIVSLPKDKGIDLSKINIEDLDNAFPKLMPAFGASL